MRFGPAHLERKIGRSWAILRLANAAQWIYTLPGSCQRHGVNPFDYPKDLFTRLPAAKITQIKEFAPAAWAKVKKKLVAQAI
jgi:hypothetical protein